MKQVKEKQLMIGLGILIFFSPILLWSQQKPLEIKWDDYNVPHIIADNEEDGFYGMGYAQMKMHGNKILRLYGQARGEAAAYWGEQYLQSDIQKHKLNIPQRAQDWFDKQDNNFKGYLTAFAKGMNDYIAKNPGEFDEGLKAVLPVRPTDPLANLQVVYHLGVAGFSLQPQAAQWKNAGSNAWAIAPSKSESGNALLMMQPHPPWVMDSYLFFESHVITPGNNRYGISAMGAPVMAMGFNENLGWGMTFNQADAMDLYSLEVKGDTYLFDSEWLPFEIAKKQIQVKTESGFKTEEIEVKKSIHGWVIEEKDGSALALRLGGLEKPFFMKQFFDMAHAKNLTEFEEAVSSIQLPLQNIVYADKHGEVFYLYNGEIPIRNNENYGYWQQVQEGKNKDNLVSEYLNYNQLPKFKNPSSGFISNTNNSPFTSTYPQAIKQEDYAGYIAPNFMDFRTQRALRMLTEDEKVSFEELNEMVFSSHSELADLAIDQLVAFARSEGSETHLQAADILNSWDRSFNSESKGAVLFSNWMFSYRGRMFKEMPNPNELFKSLELTDEAESHLSQTIATVLSKYGSLDIAWGEVEMMGYADVYMPSSIGLNEAGCFAAGGYRPMNDKQYVLVTGPAYTNVVEFGEKIRATSLLSYGNASQANYAKKGMQLGMYKQKQLKTVQFYLEELEGLSTETINK